MYNLLIFLGQNCIKVVFYASEEGRNTDIGFGRFFRTTVDSMATQSYNQLKLINMVTIVTK